MLNFFCFFLFRIVNLLRFGDGLRYFGGDLEICLFWFWILDGDWLYIFWLAFFRELKNWILLGDMYSFLNFLIGFFGRFFFELFEYRRFFLGDDGEDEFLLFFFW